MLRSKYEKSTDLINHFIITEHKELNGGTIIKYNYNKVSIFKLILYEFLNLINIKQNVKR